ncbi:MAG: DUF2207 domain-containing protein [Clostridia bacterium]
MLEIKKNSKKRKLILCFIFVLVIAFVFNISSIKASSEGYEIEDYKIDVKINEDSSIYVEEYLVYDFEEEHNGVYRDLLYRYNYKNQKDDIVATSLRYQASDIENIMVSVSDFGFYDLKYYYEEINRYPENGESDMFTVEQVQKDGYRKNIKVFSPANSDTKKYIKYEYYINDVSVLYNDAGEMYWNFIGGDWETNIENLQINISFANSNIDVSKVKFFPHSYANLTSKITENVISINAKNVKPGIAVDARLVFDKDALMYSNKIINEDYDYNKLNLVEKDMITKKNIYKFSIIGFILIGIIGIINTIVSLIRSLKYAKGNIKSKKNIDYSFQIPNECSLAEYTTMYNSNNCDLLIPTIMDLVSKKYIKMDAVKRVKDFKKEVIKIKDDKGKVIYTNYFIDKSKYDYNIQLDITKKISELSEYEILVLNILFNEESSNITNPSEFKKIEVELNEAFKIFGEYDSKSKDLNIKNQKIHKNLMEKLYDKEKGTFLKLLISSILIALFLVINICINPLTQMAKSDYIIGSFIFMLIYVIFNGIINFKFMYRLKDKYVSEYEKLMGLEKYLKKYSLMKDRYPIEIALWDRYLVFATIFGISNKVSKEFKEELLNKGYDDSYIYGIYPLINMSSNIGYVSSNINSYSFGSSSSGGYSGGGSGGGGGRWRRWRSFLIKFIKKQIIIYKGEIFMNKKIRVAQYGCGKMSVYTMRYVYEKGAQIVCAFDINKDIIGKDIGDIIGCENKGINICEVKDAKKVLAKEKPDICIITTMSLMNDVYEVFEICASLGINAISTCEEAFYPFNSNPVATKKLDKLAKENNCTLTGAGYQDVYWGNLIATIAGSSHKITKIKGSSSYNVEDYGIALAKAHGAGLNLNDFDKEVASVDKVSDEKRNEIIVSGKYLPSYMWNTNGWLAARLGLHVTTQTQVTIPKTYKEDLESSTLKMTIKKGDATGMSAVVTTNTKEGIVIESECIGKVYAKDEFDKNEWTIYGEPNTTVTINRPSTVELTCATVVNRIPDVINAKSGFVATEQMGVCEYKSESLEKYLN